MKFIRSTDKRLTADRCLTCAAFWGTPKRCHARQIGPEEYCPWLMENDYGEIVGMDAAFLAKAAPPARKKKTQRAKTQENNQTPQGEDLGGLWNIQDLQQ